MYHLRITSEDPKYERFIIQNFRNYCMVFEEADKEVQRTHSHTLCEEPMYKIQTIRDKLSKLTNKNENKMFSLTIVRDREATLCYLHKGKSREDKVLLKICNIEIKEDYHKMYWDKNDALKKKGMKKTTFMEDCIAEAKKAEIPYHGEINRDMRKDMFQMICRMLGERSKILDPMIIRRLCNGVFNVVNPVYYRNDTLFDQVYHEYSVDLSDRY